MNQRLNSIDILRGLALIGMVLVNFRMASGIHGIDPLMPVFQFFEGKSSALFVMISGLGLSFSFQKRTTSFVARTLIRSSLLLVLGLLNLVIFQADILHYYAVFFFLGIWIMPRSTRWILGLSLVLLLLTVLAHQSLNYSANWNWQTLIYKDLWTMSGFFRHLLFNGWHPVLPWIIFFNLGVVLSRNLSEEKFVQNLVFGSGLILAGVGLSQLHILFHIFPKMSLEPLPPSMAYVLYCSGIAVVLICMAHRYFLLMHEFKASHQLALLGRNTLTMYIWHIYGGMWLLEVIQGASAITLTGLLIYALVFLVISQALLVKWSEYFARGPLELVLDYVIERVFNLLHPIHR